MDEIIERAGDIIDNLTSAMIPYVTDIMRAFCSVVLYCADRGFVTGQSPVRGVLTDV
jgi:hypothetical protein